MTNNFGAQILVVLMVMALVFLLLDTSEAFKKHCKKGKNCKKPGRGGSKSPSDCAAPATIVACQFPNQNIFAFYNDNGGDQCDSRVGDNECYAPPNSFATYAACNMTCLQQ